MTEQEWYRKYVYEESDDCGLIKLSIIRGIGKPNFKDGKCEGYCHGENDDEPVEQCKNCQLHTSYGIEQFAFQEYQELEDGNDRLR